MCYKTLSFPTLICAGFCDCSLKGLFLSSKGKMLAFVVYARVAGSNPVNRILYKNK